MREMILRSLLFCIGTVLSFPTLEPHLPQSIDCPNSDIHVYINQSAVDRKEYTFVDWNAANLQDCIQKCFGNHFCYSIRFDASLDHNCALYYFAAYNCSNQALTKASTIDYKGGSITLDCIRCPGRGEFVTAPPFSSIGEQTIVSETSVLSRGKNIKGTATEITHNSEHDGKAHEEAEGKKGEEKEPIEGSGQAFQGSTDTGSEKGGEEASSSTETTLTGLDSSSVPSAESSDATTEGAEGVTPGIEPQEGATTAETGTGEGSTPNGSTASPGTESVEGSGEEGEATTPITEEHESIGESSGEGAPSTSESSSRAPGIEPTQSDLEGSGEGTGVKSATPEIGQQGEEEPEHVNVETTTTWDGHAQQPRVCSDNLRFVPSSIVDLDTVQLLTNSTKANSPAECAKICYEHNCGFAYYEPSTFVCQYMANTEELVDSTTCPTDYKDSKYQAEFRTDVASTLTCVVCAKESEVDNSKPALRPISTPRRGSYPACIISFQAAEGDHSSFPFYKSLQVHGLNECARHCFIGECSQSVYNPKTKECRLGSNPKDTCSNLPLIQKVSAPSQEVLLQCFRCVPEDLIGVKGKVSETTGYREPPTAESIDESTAHKEKEETATPSTTQETTTEEVTQADTTEETTTIAGSGDEVELTEALPEGVTERPEETTTVTESTTREEETTTYGGEEVEVEEASGESETSTEGPKFATTSSGYDSDETSTVEGGSGEEEETIKSSAPEIGSNKDYEGTTAAGGKEEEGAVTTPSGEESSTGKEEEATTTEGIESSTEGEEGTTEETVEGGEGGETTSPTEGTTLSPEESTSEGPGEMSKAIETNDKPLILASEDLDFGKSCVIKFQSAPFSSRPSTLTAPFEKTFPVDSIELCATRCFQDGCSSAKYELETKTCHLAYEDKPTCDRSELQLRMKEVTEDMWIHCVNCYPEKNVVNDVLAAPLNKTSIEEKEKEEEGKESVLDKVVGAVSDVAHSVAETVTGEKPDILKHGCIVNFQSSPSTEIGDKVEYLPPFKTRYAHRCATKCFQEGCAAATFNPTTNECSLGYGRFVKCSNTPLLTTALDIKETITIHCMSCIHHKSGEGIDLVVLSPDDSRIHLSESQDIPSQQVEGSGTEDSTVSSVAGGESTTEGIEETTAATEEGSTTTEEGVTSSSTEGETTVAEETTSSIEGAATTPEGEETSMESATPSETEGTTSSIEGKEVNGGTLGEEGGEGSGTGRISEVPLEKGAEGVQTPSGVGEVEGKVQVNGEGEGKFKPSLPTGFSVDSGLGSVQVNGKMPEEKPIEGVFGDKGSATGSAGEKPVEATTGAGIETGTGESTTALSTESTTTEEGEVSTGLTTGEEGGESSTPSTEQSTTVTSESSTEGEGREETTTEHGVMHPAKEFEHTPLHPEGEEVEVGSAETTTKEGEETSTSKDSESTTTGGEGMTTEVEGPAFVQESPSEDEEKEEGLAIANDDIKHREGILEKTLAAATPKTKEESTTVSGEKPAAAESIDSGTTVPSEEEAGKSTVAPIESSTGMESSTVESSSESSTGLTPSTGGGETESEATKETTTTSSSIFEGTPTGELDALMATDAETSTLPLTTTTSLDHKEITEGVESTTPSSIESSSTPETTTKSTVASSTEGAEPTVASSTEGAETTVASSTEGAEPTVASSTEGAETTVASSTKGAEPTVASSTEGAETTVASSTESGETTKASSTKGTVESTVAPVDGMAASIDEKTKEEMKGVDEEKIEKGEVKENGEKGAVASSLDVSTSTIAPSSDSSSTSSTVFSPAELASIVHHEKEVSSTVSPIDSSSTTSTAFSTSTVPSPEELADIVHHEKSGVSSTVSPSIDSSSTVSPDISTSTVPSPSQLSEIVHEEEKGESLSTSTVPSPSELASISHEQKEGGKDKEIHEQPSEVKETGAVGATTSSSIDSSSTVTSSEGTTPVAESTASSIEGEMNREGIEESTTSSFGESTTSGISSGTESSSVSSDAESTTSSSVGIESTTSSESSHPSIDNEKLIEKALATAAPKEGESSTPSIEGTSHLATLVHDEKEGHKESEVGEEEDKIHSTSISPVEGVTSSTETATSSTGESIDGGIDRALSAIGEKTTTEPPVQAVKDLLDALASGDFDRALLAKKNGTEAEKLLKGKTQITEQATPINQKHECTTGNLRFATFELVDLTTKFEADAIAFSLPHCARLCYEVGCTMAAYSRFPRPLCLMHFEKDEKESHRCNSETNRTSYWEYSSLQQVVAIDCILCEGQTFFGHDQTVDITTLHAIDDSIVTVPSPQGISKNCDGGRLEFQFVPAGSLPRLNVTNDVPARTPADCARRCHETKGCTTAGFIPTPSADIANGVCLLTSDDEVCISREDAVPQHASVTAFVISCIRCTRCSYTLSHMTLSSSTAKFQHIATVNTIGECAEVCHDKKCVFAQYDATTNTCALSMEASHETGCNKVETSLAVKGSYPVRLECVQCRE